MRIGKLLAGGLVEGFGDHGTKPEIRGSETANGQTSPRGLRMSGNTRRRFFRIPVAAGVLSAALIYMMLAAPGMGHADASPSPAARTGGSNAVTGPQRTAALFQKWNELLAIRVGGISAYEEVFAVFIPGLTRDRAAIEDYRFVYGRLSRLRAESEWLLTASERLFLNDMENRDTTGAFGDLVREGF